MCGICGSLNADINQDVLRHATDQMIHRGPDESGYYFDGTAALGMRRLSIIDLAGGSQPKTNEDSSIHVVFNGEIYNYRELRDELRRAGHTFTSNSDTEVIVHGYEEWGPACFQRLNGIFGVAVWDVPAGRLILARDHLGVKPLYYSAAAGRIAFGSELKPVLALLGEVPPIDPIAVAQYLRYQYVPAPRSIFSGIHKLPPAHYLVMGRDGGEPMLRRYWDPEEIARSHQRDISYAEALDLVDDTVAEAVRRQLVADVPLGAFLSGGVDSSAVVAAMQRVSGATTKTFSIGFEEAESDESGYAAAVAKHLGTDHHSLTVTHDDSLAVVPKLPRYFDEPFADASAVPTYLVSQLARSQVTVSLSGDGGDELFGGYTRYDLLERGRRWWTMPRPARRMALAGAQRLPAMAAGRLQRVADILQAPDLADAYKRLICITPRQLLTEVSPLGPAALLNPEWPAHLFSAFPLSEAMMLTDLGTYLPDDILTKVDRASMAHSLEARVPLLDLDLVQLALSLPPEIRLQHGPKALLKDALKRHVPAALVDRPKHGFSIPIHAWLRDGMRDCLLDYLSPTQLDRHSLFRTEVVTRLVQAHLERRGDWGYVLWALLAFQLWHEALGQDAAALTNRPVEVQAPDRPDMRRDVTEGEELLAARCQSLASAPTRRVSDQLPAISYLIEGYPPRVGGAEVQAHRVARLLAEQFKVRVITSVVPDQPRRERLDGVDVIRIPWDQSDGKRAALRNAGQLVLGGMRQRADLVQGFQLNGLTAAAASVAAARRVPLVIKVAGRGNLDRLSDGALGQLLMKAATAVVVPSHSCARATLAAGVPASKLCHIPNGVDTDHFVPAEPGARLQLRKQAGYQPDDVIFIWVGGIRHVKGLDCLPPVWDRLHVMQPRARLLIVGEGPDDAPIRELAARYPQTVRHLPFQEDVLSLYQMSDALFLPSRSEGLSNMLLEGLSCGLLAAVSSVPENVEVGPGEEWLVPFDRTDPDDIARALGEIIEKRAGRPELGLLARKKIVETYGLQQGVARWSALYASLIHEGCR